MQKRQGAGIETMARSQSCATGLGSSIVFRVMDAENALFRYPSRLIGCDQFPYPMLADKLQVADHAHAVFGPVAFVHEPEPIAWKFTAAATIFPVAFGAGAHFTGCPAFGQVLFGMGATAAGIPGAQESTADAAVHAARGNQVWSDLLFAI